jgi:hypothetical protein
MNILAVLLLTTQLTYVCVCVVACECLCKSGMTALIRSKYVLVCECLCVCVSPVTGTAATAQFIADVIAAHAVTSECTPELVGAEAARMKKFWSCRQLP